MWQYINEKMKNEKQTFAGTPSELWASGRTGTKGDDDSVLWRVVYLISVYVWRQIL